MVGFVWRALGPLLMLFFAAGAVADGVPAPLVGVALNQRVIDLTGTLGSADKNRLTGQLAALEQRKGAQIAVMMLSGTGETDIETFANQLFRAWKLGRKSVDDGVLLLVAKDDRRVRIEVGYGLEGTVTDLLAHRIIEERITPEFRRGDYLGGIEQGVNALIALVDGDSLAEPVEPAMPGEAWAALAAFVLGSVGGVLIAAGRLRWRQALVGSVLATALLVAATAGGEWLASLLVVPLCLLVGGATFGALWQVRPLFYGVVALLGYIGGVVLADQYVTEMSFINWLAWPAAAALAIAALLLLVVLMLDAWRENRLMFALRLAVVVAAYVFIGYSLHGADGWLMALPICLFGAILMFLKGVSGGGSGGGSSGRSGSGSGGGFSGGGGSSGGGGASGSW